MAVKVGKKIIGYKVKPSVVEAKNETPLPVEAKPLVMNEAIERPEFLLGTTYKIKPPVSEHAFYITINDIVLNVDTDHESRFPYEIFINSKSMEHFQWVIALTRVISAVFRKGGDITFLMEELLSVHDPSGGYYKKGGVFVPSLVAEIGSVIERHMKALGIIESEELNDAQRRLIAEKRADYESRQQADDLLHQSDNPLHQTGETGETAFPPGAVSCKKCLQKSVIMLDGCLTCLNCGDSKCG